MKNTFFGSLTMLLSFSGILSAADALPVEIGQLGGAVFAGGVLPPVLHCKM